MNTLNNSKKHWIFRVPSIKIEKGIPISMPTKKFGKWQQILIRLDIGDSFEAESDLLGNILSAAKSLELNVKSHKVRYGTVRVWRVK